MQRLQGWVRYAADITGRSSRTQGQQQQQQQQQQDSDEEDFIYARIAVHSDDEDKPGTSSKAPRQRKPRVSAPSQLPSLDSTAPASPLAGDLPAVQLTHGHCHSDGELNHLDSTYQHQRISRQTEPGHINSLNRIESAENAGWEPDWEDTGDAASSSQQQVAQQQQPQQPQSSTEQSDAAAAGPSSSSSSRSRPSTGGGRVSASAATAAALAELEPSAGFDADDESEEPSAGPSRSSSGVRADGFDYSGEVPDHDHSQKRRELLIYAIPLTRGKVIFLPVCPWRVEPEQHQGWRKAVTGHVGKVQSEASDLWQKMATAEQGTLVHRVYKLGKRVLDSISPEERLMRGVPKDISKVIIHHPSQVSPDTIMDLMSTMTKNYGIKAVGRAAAATVMLPLAVGVDLIILPGPQVLTYYTMWELYRNTNGAVGSTRMTKFVTQSGTSENIRVNYVVEPRLDKYHDLANDCPEGVLTEDDLEALVTDLREPDLLEALLSLRNKALRELGRRTSRGGEEYVALPPTDPAAAQQGFGNTRP